MPQQNRGVNGGALIMGKRLRVVVSGGGTGGHIYPALALGKEITATNRGQVLFIGSHGGMESEIVPPSGIEFEAVSSAGLERRITPKNALTILKAGKGLWEALRILQKFRPNIVVGTGGYVCGPVVLAAWLKRIPTVIHEQNAFPGLTNRILARFTSRVCVTFEESLQYFCCRHKAIVTGLPVRREILKAGRNEAAAFFKFDPGLKTILIVGGSRGAKTINSAAVHILGWLAEEPSIQLIWVTGRTGYEDTMDRIGDLGIELNDLAHVRVVPYLNEMHFGLAAADVVIARAGASFLAEVTARGVPSILVPYPYASGNHQEHNADAMALNGAARVIKDNLLQTSCLLNEVRGLLLSGDLERMAENSRKMGKPRALEEILSIVFSTAGC